MHLDHTACYRALVARDARFDGRLFIAVKTTRVYCRPVCPARTPKSENVMFFSSAAAAQETGYRPCLRCRPETAPDSVAWRGASGTVSRALALIEDGALDDAGIVALSDRLNVGERQLRRLFRQHLGATPIAVAQTRRVLLAKQLIHETDLPITEIAFASGFGSVRRFNETFQALFRRPPSALRHRARADRGASAATHAGVDLLLRYRAPYDWPAMLDELRRHAVAGVETVEGGVYRRAIAFGTRQGMVSVRQGRGATLAVNVRFPMLSLLPTIIARLRRVFDLAADPQAINAHLGCDPRLAGSLAVRPGLRVPGSWEGFESVLRAMLRGAGDDLARLVAAFGAATTDPHMRQHGLTHCFPVPQSIVGVARPLSGAIAADASGLAPVARTFMAEPRLFDAGRSLDEAVALLRAVPGIDEPTAQAIAMRQMRETDAFPFGDAEFLRAAAATLGAATDASELARCAEAWSPWRAYAAQHLSTLARDARQSGCDAVVVTAIPAVPA